MQFHSLKLSTMTTAEQNISPKDKNPYQPKINSIRKVIYAEDKRIREKYPLLQHQNAIGMTWFVLSFGLVVTSCYLYYINILPWYFLIPLVGRFVSILHELEHDLIHDMYFKEQKWIQHIMFAVIWISKVNANPWWRKPMHLKHHKTSGQLDDIEERLIGLGEPIGLKRLLITLSPLGTYTVMLKIAKDSKRMNSLPGLDILKLSLVNLPILTPFNLAFFALFMPGLLPEYYYNIAFYACMFLYFPNMLRQACLQIVSTGCHYFGDIPDKNVYFQNQVLNHWIFYPLQMFCFNFGATHISDHYVTRQPFYLRQIVASAVLVELKKQGVRFNDLQIFQRDHRFHSYNGIQEPSSDLSVKPVAIGA